MLFVANNCQSTKNKKARSYAGLTVLYGLTLNYSHSIINIQPKNMN